MYKPKTKQYRGFNPLRIFDPKRPNRQVRNSDNNLSGR